MTALLWLLAALAFATRTDAGLVLTVFGTAAAGLLAVNLTAKACVIVAERRRA